MDDPVTCENIERRAPSVDVRHQKIRANPGRKQFAVGPDERLSFTFFSALRRKKDGGSVRTEQQYLALALVFLRILLDLTVYHVRTGLALGMATRGAVAHVCLRERRRMLDVGKCGGCEVSRKGLIGVWGKGGDGGRGGEGRGGDERGKEDGGDGLRWDGMGMRWDRRLRRALLDCTAWTAPVD